MLTTIFKDARKLLGDTYLPYRNTDDDIIDALSSCIDSLYHYDKDLFLNDSFVIRNDFSIPFPRESEKEYFIGDMIYVNDPMSIYICTVAGSTALVSPEFNDISHTDGTVSWSKWDLPPGVHSNAVLHYICWFCLLMDNDEQANERSAEYHKSMFERSK